MAISLSKKKLKPSKKVERNELCWFFSMLSKWLYRVPAAIMFLVLIFLWSSSTTIISGNIVHVCVSSRKLNSLYCLSAGARTKPNFEIPITDINGSPTSPPHPDNNIINNNNNNTNIKENVRVHVVDAIHIDDVKDEADPVVRNRAEEHKDEVAEAMKVVEEQVELHRSWVSKSWSEGCEDRGIYVYDLPSKFNTDLLGQCVDMIPWMDFCKYFRNKALGEPIPELGEAWYKTHQYSLEPIFHSRILTHPCRVHDPARAKLFYVPFYGGLDILRWHFKNVSNDVKDSLALDMLKWLGTKSTWGKNSGKDHVFVLGKISWDFRRKPDYSWGTRLLELPEMQNPVKLLIERQPWHENDIGIPHPTHFHPRSDDDIIAWQRRIISSYRRSLVSFAGAARPGDPDSIRSALIRQCTSAEPDRCRFLDCSSGVCGRPESVIELFMTSEFCLQPPGDSPTRKSVFDSLVSGCIPVIFDPFTAYYQYPWHLPEDHGKYSVFIDQEEVRGGKVNVVERLMKISDKERDDMRRYIVYELLPGLVYADPSSSSSSSSGLTKFQDAFDITVNSLLHRLTTL